MNFGDFIKKLRLGKGLTLRRFCLEHNLDPGNHSKLERGMLSPPQDEVKLQNLAYALGLLEESEEWKEFIDLAVISNGKIPEYILSDEEIVSKLPLFFRTVKGEKLKKDKLDKLIKLIKEN